MSRHDGLSDTITTAKAEAGAYGETTLRSAACRLPTFLCRRGASEGAPTNSRTTHVGPAESVRLPACCDALTRLRKITEQVDDSSGSIGDQVPAGPTSNARACRLGEPTLSNSRRGLVKHSAPDSPGWPNVV